MPAPAQTSLLGRVARRGAGWVAAFAIVFVCAFAALRVATPWLAEQRAAIEKLVSELLGQPVSIGAVALAWEGLTPSLRLHDVAVLSERGDAVLKFGSVYMEPATLGSLFDRRLQLAALHIVDARIHVIRTRDGEIRVRGLDVRSRAASQGGQDIMLIVRSSRVRWEDRALSVDYRFSDVDFVLNTHGDRHRLALRANLPLELGGRLTAIANLRGRLREPATWQGQVYVQATDVHAGSLPAAMLPAELGGELTLEAWSSWRDGRLARLVGQLGLDEARLVGATAPELDHLSGKFRWHRTAGGWAADIAELKFARTGRPSPSSSASLRYHAESGRQARLRGAISHLHLEDVVALLLASNRLDDTTARELIARQPQGALRAMRFALTLGPDEIRDYVAGGRFTDLSVNPTAQIAGINGADGRFRLEPGGGSLRLNAHDVRVRHPRLFDAALHIDELHGPVRWWREDDRLRVASPALVARNEDAKLRGRFVLVLGGSSPHLDLRLRVAEGHIARIEPYLPVGIIKPELHEWLSRALVDGRLTQGEVIFKGDLADFPLREQEGVFEARLNVEQAILNYRPDWPRVEAIEAQVTFRGPSLTVVGREARVLDSRIEAATVHIPDLREGDLRLQARARGPLEDIFGYLTHSDLVQPETFERFAVDGRTRLELELRLPLSKELEEKIEPQVRAVAHFEDADLRIAPWNLAFTSAKGGVSFSTVQGFHAENIRAHFRGEPVRINVATGPDKRTAITASGHLPASAVFGDLKHPVLAQMRGVSAWRAQVSLPPLQAADVKPAPAPVRLNLESELVGTAVDLPQPLGKPAAEARRFSLEATVGGDPTAIRARYGAAVSAVMALTESMEGLQLSRGELRVNRGRAQLPNKGFYVKADLATLDVSKWQALLAETAPQPPPESGVHRGIPLRGVEATVQRLEFAGNVFADLRLTARRGAHRWLATIDSSRLKGRIAAPLHLDTQVPLIANLEFLRWDTGQAVDAQTDRQFDPRQLPPLRVAAERLSIDELEFTGLVLRTAPRADGLQVQRLELKASDFQGQARGTWRVTGAGQQSSFDLMLKSPELGALLRRWDLLHSMRDGVARAEAHLTWPGSPFEFALKGLEGRASLRVEDGRLRELEPGAGRLLGLLNIDAITRRLSLDFSDLFRTGFSFDTIKGNVGFNEGVMHTDNLSIEGPSAEIGITGDVGLVTRTYDLRVAVVPEIISGLPLAGAILGGPVVGAAVFVAGKIAEEIDSTIDEGTPILYSITGPWQDPEVTLLKAPRAQTRTQRNFPYNQR
jgi:uncharacterized protein (TIGR02099 family)